MQVTRWHQRWLEAGLEGIERDLPRGAPPVKVDVKHLVAPTTQHKPEAASQWSTRKRAALWACRPARCGALFAAIKVLDDKVIGQCRSVTSMPSG